MIFAEFQVRFILIMPHTPNFTQKYGLSLSQRGKCSYLNSYRKFFVSIIDWFSQQSSCVSAANEQEDQRLSARNRISTGKLILSQLVANCPAFYAIRNLLDAEKSEA
jgi:hypothetical protein